MIDFVLCDILLPKWAISMVQLQIAVKISLIKHKTETQFISDNNRITQM